MRRRHIFRERMDERAKLAASGGNRLAFEEREYRNKLLAESDWTQLHDAPLSNSMVREWQTYRQALRDITLQPGFPYKVEYPTKPTG